MTIYDVAQKEDLGGDGGCRPICPFFFRDFCLKIFRGFDISSFFFFFFSLLTQASKYIGPRSRQESNSSLLTWDGGVAYRLDLDEKNICIY